jgi:hypothetical protein
VGGLKESIIWSSGRSYARVRKKGELGNKDLRKMNISYCASGGGS